MRSRGISGHSWIYFKDRDSKFIQVNKALADYSGIPAPDMIGKSDADFLDKESAGKNRSDEIRILASGKGRERFIERESQPDADDEWVLTSKLPLRDRQGRINPFLPSPIPSTAPSSAPRKKQIPSSQQKDNR